MYEPSRVWSTSFFPKVGDKKTSCITPARNMLISPLKHPENDNWNSFIKWCSSDSRVCSRALKRYYPGEYLHGVSNGGGEWSWSMIPEFNCQSLAKNNPTSPDWLDPPPKKPWKKTQKKQNFAYIFLWKIAFSWPLLEGLVFFIENPRNSCKALGDMAAM